MLAREAQGWDEVPRGAVLLQTPPSSTGGTPLCRWRPLQAGAVDDLVGALHGPLGLLLQVVVYQVLHTTTQNKSNSEL